MPFVDNSTYSEELLKNGKNIAKLRQFGAVLFSF